MAPAFSIPVIGGHTVFGKKLTLIWLVIIWVVIEKHRVSLYLLGRDG